MQDPLLSNKVAGAALACLLLFFGIPILVNKFAGGGHHGSGHGGSHISDHEKDDHMPEDNPLALAYPIAFSFGPVAASAEEIIPDLGTLLAAADPERGQKKIVKCTGCHTLEVGGGNLQGPNLYDIIGRPIGSIAGFAYTSEVREAGGLWDYERLNSYIENSQAYLPGTAMVQKIRKPKERADILAYLSTLSDDPVPFPAPIIAEPKILAPSDNGVAPAGSANTDEAVPINDNEEIAGQPDPEQTQEQAPAGEVIILNGINGPE